MLRRYNAAGLGITQDPHEMTSEPYESAIPMGGRDDVDRYFAWLDSQVDVETANAIASLAFNPGRKN